jgi:NarL family two-component system sensor histidine kinase YdfH
MKTSPVFQQIKNFFSIPDQVDAEEYRLSRPFFILLIFVLLFIYGFALYNQPELGTLGRFSAFTFLMALHIVLHWRSIAIIQRPDREVPYVLVQSVIALLIVYMLDELGLAFGVVAAMIGESVGILRKKRGIAVLVVIFLLTGMFGTLQLSGGYFAPVIWLASIPLVLFVVIFVELYSRQDEARQHAGDLLRKLETAHGELTLYADQVEELTLLAERERMAFELHDTLGQGVAGIVLQLEAVKNHLENGRTGRAEQIVSQAMHKARTTLADSRAVIDDLRHTQNVSGSFTDIIMQLVAEFNQTSGTTIDLNIAQLPTDLVVPALVVEHTKRIISEALFNVVQHAQASQVSLTVMSAANELDIAIKDDGLGFDQTRIGQDGHYGLLGMQQRAQQLGGTCLVVSQPNQGTLIKVSFPLKHGGER